jgi:hypothetical protein
MKWKGILAMLLAVIFPSASSWAAVCDLACASSTQRHVCPSCGSSSHTAAAHMHCAQMDGQESSLAVHVELTASSQCTHSFCAQPVSVNLPTKAFQSDQLKWALSHEASHLEGGVIPFLYIDRAPPPIPVASDRPLTVTLRI